MTITVRLDEKLSAMLEEASRNSGVTRSELVRQSVEAYLGQQRGQAQIAWETGKGLFGKYGSGKSDVSTNAERHLREYFESQKSPH